MQLLRVKIGITPSTSRHHTVIKELLYVLAFALLGTKVYRQRTPCLSVATLLPGFGRSGNKHKPCRDAHPREGKFNRTDDNPAKVK
jgi:hypothetical protein